MKQVKIKLPLRALTLASGLLLTVSSFGRYFTICIMSSANPISSMRSASSKMKKDTLERSTYPKLRWLIKRPGVAITTSAPKVSPFFSCSKRIPSFPPYTATLDAGIK